MMSRSRKQYLHNITATIIRCVKPALALMLIGVFIIDAINPVYASQSAASTRPISEFVSQQGTFCFDDGMGGCFLFVPPIPNFVGWADGRTFNGVSVDYAGLADATYGGV